MGEGRDSEEFVKELFEARYGLELVKVAESDVQSPDFEVFFEARRVAVLEVKNTEYTGLTLDPDQVEDRFRTTEKKTGVSGLMEGATRNDNSVSRIRQKVRKAVKQFHAYSDPKVLVLVNEELGADHFDLKEVLQGYLNYGGVPLTSLGPSEEERLQDARGKIDLYFWINRMGEPETKAYWTTETGRALWRSHFATPKVPVV